MGGADATTTVTRSLPVPSCSRNILVRLMLAGSGVLVFSMLTG